MFRLRYRFLQDFPDYYEMIKEPIDLKTIAQRIRMQHYRTLNNLEKDIKLMCKNAKQFNEPGSAINKVPSWIPVIAAQGISGCLDDRQVFRQTQTGAV